MRAQSREVVAIHRFIKHLRKLIQRRLGLSLDEKRTTAVETKHRMRTANADVLNTRQRPQSVFEFRQKKTSLLIILVLLSAKTHLRSHQPIDLPARICIDEALQATQEQSRCREQHHRKRDFTDDQQMPQAMLRSSRGRPA